MDALFARLFDTPFSFESFDAVITPLALLVRLILPLGVAILLYRLLLTLLRHKIGRLRAQFDTAQRLYRYVRTILRTVLVALALLLVYGLFGANASRGAVILWNILSTPIIETAGSSISLVTVIFAIPIGYMAVWAARTGSGFLKTRALARLPLTEATRFSIGGITHYLILSVTLVLGLSFLGINLSTFSVLVGTLGIGIGFGLQNVVASFVSGLVIIFERPIKEGDRVVVDGTEGDVAHIRLRSTVITTLTDETIIVPNHQLVGNKIYNNSHEVRRITVINQVQVAYGTDLDFAAEVLKGVALASPYARATAEPDVRVREFGDSGVLMELWTGIEDAGTKWPAHSWANFEIARAFRRTGITIPFPQRDLHVKTLPGGVALEPAPSPAE